MIFYFRELLLPALVLMPVLLVPLSRLFRTARGALWFGFAGNSLAGLAGCGAIVCVFLFGKIYAAGDWLMLDMLSAWHLAVLLLITMLCSLYSVIYFLRESQAGKFDLKTARRYVMLSLGSLSAIVLTLLSNNLGMMWVGLEATTLLTAFLICLNATPTALEAMWKYLLMCSVGVALAFAGILIVAASTSAAHFEQPEFLLWSRMMESAGQLDARLLKVGFIFLVVGFGTKAGLAPMHSWLPDAHSQAPAPVSAVFSGFLLNAALYCILRYVPLLDAALGGGGWAGGILVLFGLVSILIAAVFIVAQRDLKRLLAYSSVEHMGIIALGIGLGGLGVFAALFHVLNHSLCKTLSFFCAGRLDQKYGAHDMRKLTGILKTSPVWGTGLFGGLLALIGLAPFAVFISEFLVLKAAWDKGAIWALALFVTGLCIVFVGVLRHAIAMAWEDAPHGMERERIRGLELFLMALPLATLLTLGLWMPEPLNSFLTQAAAILGGK